MLDMALYLSPSSPISAYMLNSGENCYSYLDPKGYCRFLKNDHYETLWVDDQYVYRGLDSSNLPNEVYAQFTGERYGAAWCKRWVNVGDVTERNPDIRTYDANGKLLRTASGGVSYLHVVARYNTWAIPETGQTVADVVELTWTFDVQGKNIIERYWYAHSLGLVGFSYYVSPPLHTRFSGLTNVKPTFTPLPNFAEPVPPPVEKETTPMPDYVSPPTTGGVKAAVSKMPGSFLNIREQPSADSADKGDLLKDEIVTYFPNWQRFGWAYVIRESDGVKGWVSLQNGAVEFAPELLPEPEPEVITATIYTGAEHAALVQAVERVVGLLKGVPSNSGDTFPPAPAG